MILFKPLTAPHRVFASHVDFFHFSFRFKTIKATSQLGDPRVTYNLEDGMVPETNMPVRFYLSPNREDGSASILVSEPLDYETTPLFSLRVRAQNVAAVPLAAFTTVYVNVTGGNVWRFKPGLRLRLNVKCCTE